MKHKVMHVKGRLNPSNPDAVTKSTYDRVNAELVRNALASALSNPASFSDSERKLGQIHADSHAFFPGGGRPAAMDFITRLYAFVTTPGVAELGLEGELIVTADAVKEPVVFKVEVKDNNVFYQQAELTYAEPVPFMEKTEDISNA